MEEFRLDNPPTDCISCIRFAPKSDVLIMSSWDRSISLYDTDKSKMLQRFETKAAVLSCDIINSDMVCYGGLDCLVKVYDFQKKQEHVIGKHTAAVSCVIYVEAFNYVISSSWDRSVKIWDPTPGATQSPLFELKQNNKVYTMAVSNDLKLFLALDERQIVVYDLKDLSKPLLNRECLLKYNTRSLCPLLDGSGFIVGSIEGRVGVEYLTESDTNKPFSFRCHRTKDSFGTEMIYPVNAIAMHPVYGTFATGGADGSVCVWDAAAKKRLAYFPNYVPGIACLAFNRDGTQLAIACSYTFEQGTAVNGMTNFVCIRSIKPNEVTPKSVSP